MTEIPVDTLLALPLDDIVQRLPRFLGSYVTERHGARDAVVAGLEEVRRTGSGWAELLEHMRHLGGDFGGYERNPLATKIATAYMTPLLPTSSSLESLDQLAKAEELAAGRRLMIVGNHLSYVDTMTLCVLMERAGRGDERARVTPVAGPKVYTEPMRRLAAASMNSIKVAQSASVASGGAQMNPREVVRITRRCLGVAEELMDAGKIVLIYPEGTRSRTGRLGTFLRAVNRWLNLPGVVILPTAVWGTERLYSIDDDMMEPAECHARFGAPLDVDALREAGVGRNGVLEAAWEAIDGLLPPEYQAEPGTPRIT